MLRKKTIKNIKKTHSPVATHLTDPIHAPISYLDIMYVREKSKKKQKYGGKFKAESP